MKKKTKQSCLIVNCDRPVVSRGCCQTCYGEARRAVRAGEITDEELIRRGLLLPPHRAAMRRAIERSE